MNPLYVGLLLVLIPSLMMMVNSILKDKRAGSAEYQNNLEDFRRKAEELLQPGETVEAVCGHTPYAAVSGSRLFVGKNQGIEVIEFSSIKSLKGVTLSGDKTKDPQKMWMITVKADKKYTICNQSNGFEQLVEVLARHVGL